MNFAFNEEQNAIRDVVARFSAEVLAPGYRKRDQEGVIEKDVISPRSGRASCRERV